MGIRDYFSNHAETKETHFVQTLRTRYYKHSSKEILDLLESYFKKSKDASVKTRDDEHGELFAEGRRFHIIVTVHSFTPRETSVDFKVQTYRLVGAHRPKKIIQTIYAYLDKNLTLKGVALHP
ncbi:MAG: hypothetical protein ACOCSM_01665 [Bacillota bacterium]